ncbi:PHP domain-containing protein [Nonomuraea thailandensis]
MGHGHHHHDHDHDHAHERPGDTEAAAARDLAVPDGELSPGQLSRRRMFRRAGLLGAGLTAAGVLGGEGQAAATATAATRDEGRGREPRDGYQWLAGDHHIHTQYSSDGIYRVIDHVRHANAFGLGWMVITDHGGAAHAKIGVEKVNPDIVAAREAVKDTLVFQGLEWNIPAAEHGTVFVAPAGARSRRSRSSRAPSTGR